MSILFRATFICNLCLTFICCQQSLEFGSYVDDATPFSCGEILDQIVNEPEETYG